MSPFELKTQHLILELRYAREIDHDPRTRAALSALLAAAHEDSPHLGLDRAVMTLKTAGPK